ncbi:hypothetical protein E2562_009030 [Oryza meyeriana var. granulata]|uniref:Uncharacterized protein n=1 Tax=Oryza meyeriana var. granulata TaxID=110450 RepID=A0A6G1D2P8_9ORYZ|nr:hypothetical protein E2562_009030 [Oryza meyeriana var. granulata]
MKSMLSEPVKDTKVGLNMAKPANKASASKPATVHFRSFVLHKLLFPDVLASTWEVVKWLRVVAAAERAELDEKHSALAKERQRLEEGH